MNICHVFQDEYPWDIRVEKISDALTEAGHRTVIVSRNRSGLPRHEQLHDGLEVVRLPAGLTSIDRTLMNVPAFFSPWWLSAVVNTVRRADSDLILVRDLPLAPTAVLVGRITGTPVVMDMAENYPAMLEATWAHRSPRPHDLLLRNPQLLRRLEERILPRLDGVFVVSRASRNRVVALTRGRCPVWVVGNTPRLDRRAPAQESELAGRLVAHPGPVLLYVGNMDAKRGLEVVIRALPILRERNPRVLAVIVGKGTEEPRLRRIAFELGVSENVLMPGWIDQREVPSVIAASDVGLIPHRVSEHTNTTIPNKIYDYMAEALPVVASSCEALKEIVESSHCGMTFPDGDHVALARVVEALMDPAISSEMGSFGRKAVVEHFNWDRDATVLLGAIEQVCGRNSRRPRI